jgi:hypothetical protein
LVAPISKRSGIPTSSVVVALVAKSACTYTALVDLAARLVIESAVECFVNRSLDNRPLIEGRLRRDMLERKRPNPTAQMTDAIWTFSRQVFLPLNDEDDSSPYHST